MAGYDGRGARFPLTIVRGADLAFQLTVTSGGSAVDLSAATIAGEVYNASGTLVDTMTAAVSGAGSNIVTLSFTDTETTALTLTGYRWTLWVTRGGDKRPWLAGQVTVTDGTTGQSGSTGAYTLTVDEDVSVAVEVATVGGSGGGASALDDLTDVTITTPITGNSLMYNGSAWVNATYAPVTVAGTTDTLAATDNGKVNIYSNASLVTITLPTDGSDDLIDGFECLLVAAGAAGITLSTSGLTLIGSTPTTTAAQDESIYVKKTGTANTWLIIGPAAGGGGGATNLTWTAATSTVASDTGTDAVLTAVDGTNPGLMTVALKTKLDGIETAADVTDATNVSAAGAPIISSGAGAPASTPSKVGDVYIDTTNDDAYTAVGTASSADWEKHNDGGGGGGDIATDTIWDAKGDLAVGTGANTAAKLTAGTNGYVLTADSAEVTGLKWAVASGGSSDPLAADFIISGRIFSR